jgi:hypothetical protein
MDNAIRYGVAQIQSIVTPDSIQDSLHDFEMLSTISRGLADVLRDRLEAGRPVEQKGIET